MSDRGRRGRDNRSHRGGNRQRAGEDFGEVSAARQKEKEAMAANMSPEVRAWFQDFQTELDEKHDKYERIVKLGRDVTIESKRIIFQLHRITTAKGATERADVLDQAMNRLHRIRTDTFRAIGKELVNEDHYHFLRAYSPGLQEFIEATTFLFYLRESRLLTLGEVQASLVFPEPGVEPVERVTVPLTEYLLGVGDIAGEVMRYAINSVSAGDMKAPKTVAGFLKNLHRGFLLLGRVDARDFGFKVETLRRCVVKVENAEYALRLRGSEVPEHMLADILTGWRAEVGPDDDTDFFQA